MAMIVDITDPAFPDAGDEYMQVADGSWQPKSHYGMAGSKGMSLLQYYAGQILQGWIAAQGGLGTEIRTTSEVNEVLSLGLDAIPRLIADRVCVANRCYDMAEEMIQVYHDRYKALPDDSKGSS